MSVFRIPTPLNKVCIFFYCIKYVCGFEETLREIIERPISPRDLCANVDVNMLLNVQPSILLKRQEALEHILKDIRSTN